MGAGKKVFIVAGVIAFLAAGIIGLVVVAGIVLPGLNSAREVARRSACMANVKAIGLSLKQYADDNEGCFPSGKKLAGLEMIRRKYLKDDMLLVCPSSSATPAKPGTRLAHDSVSYIYLGDGVKHGDASKDIAILCDEPGNHGKFGVVLFGDGHIAGLSGEEWLEQAGLEEVK